FGLLGRPLKLEGSDLTSDPRIGGDVNDSRDRRSSRRPLRQSSVVDDSVRTCIGCRGDLVHGATFCNPYRCTRSFVARSPVGVTRGDIELGDLVRPMTMAADTAEAGLAGRPTTFSWLALASGKPSTPGDLRRFIQVEPVLDFSALEPGRAATEAVVKIASDL